jgi:hypothetical protein
MSELQIYYKDESGDVQEDVVEDAEYVDMLANTNRLAVDGEVYNNVIQARVADE